jgi:monovalent cation:H+ antiporter, CPA1 family
MTALASLSGTAATAEEVLVFLLVLAAIVAIIAKRVGVPYTVGLVVVGLVLGLVTRIDAVRLSSDLVFYVFLPILLFDAGFNLEAGHLLTDWRRIAALAIPGVLVAFAITAGGVYWVGGTALAVALLFAALIAATDPVSVVALFRRLGVSDRLTTMIDAESLFNDGTAAVIFAIVLGGVVEGGRVTAVGAVGQFLWMTVGGLGLGLALGYAASFIHRYVDDHLVEITLSTIIAYGSFLLGQWLGMSGVVACVTAAVVLGNYGQHRNMGPVTRVTMSTVWEYAAFIANSLIFLLIGLRIDLGTITANVGLVLIGFVAVLAGRAVTIYGYGLVSRVAGRKLPLAWQHVLFWGGLRGTIALALVLSVPDDLPGRATLQVLTFGVVLMSLVLQGLTMPPLARRLHLADAEEAAARSRQRARLLDGFVAAHAELDRLQESGTLPRVEQRHVERTIEAQENVLLEGLDPVADEPAEGEDERLSERMGALLAQRRRVNALRNAGVLDHVASDDLTDEIDRRLALLADRLVCARDGVCGDEGVTPEAPGP